MHTTYVVFFHKLQSIFFFLMETKTSNHFYHSLDLLNSFKNNGPNLIEKNCGLYLFLGGKKNNLVTMANQNDV